MLLLGVSLAVSAKPLGDDQILLEEAIQDVHVFYREGGIMALRDKRTERTMTSGKNPPNKELTAPYPIFNSAQEELEYLRAENAYLKKLHALAREKQQRKQK